MKNIPQMLYKQILSICFLIALFGGTVLGQAGPDQDVCEGESVTLGTENSSDKCYIWEPTTGLSDPRSGMPEANPTETTTYTLTVIGSNFSSRTTDQVKVTIVDLESVSAEPKICCWKKGDPITKDQFEITIDPPSVKSQIEVSVLSPTTAPAVTFATGEVEVTLRVTCGTNTEDITTTIKVVDEDFEISHTPTEFSGDILESKLQRFASYLPGPCTPSVSISGGLTFAGGKLCCPDGSECIKSYFKPSGSASLAGGISCALPVPYRIPYVAEANIIVGVGLNGAAEASIKTGCTPEENEFCFELKAGGSITGGVGVDVLGGKLIEAQLVVIGSASFPVLKKCKGSPTETFGSLCGKVDVEGSVTFASFYSKKVAVNVVSQRCW